MTKKQSLAVKRGGGVARLETEAEEQRRERARRRLVLVRRLRRDLRGDGSGHSRRLEALERRFRERTAQKG